jgi:predicted transcriptional regulator
VSKREIARVLGISRVAVRKVLRSNSTALPELHRTEKAEPYRQQILELSTSVRGISCESMRIWWGRARRCRTPR